MCCPKEYTFSSSLGKGMLLAILVKEKSVGNFCIETQKFCDFVVEKGENLVFLSRKMKTHSTFVVEFSLGCYLHKNWSSYGHHFGDVGCTPLHIV